jgi:hypothetical protein
VRFANARASSILGAVAFFFKKKYPGPFELGEREMKENNMV